MKLYVSTDARPTSPRLVALLAAAAGILLALAMLPAPHASAAQSSGQSYTPMTPARVADTRETGRVAPGQTLRVNVVGDYGVPTDASAVVLNVTATGAGGYGFVTVYPCGTTRPTASNLNYTAGQTVPNAVFAKVGSNGQVCLYSSQSTHLIVDVNGWYAGDAAYVPKSPARLADTRSTGTVAGGETLRVKVAGTAGVPADASAVVLNVTATGASGYGFVTVYPCGTTRPTASNLNYTAGRTAPNAVVAKVGSSGEVCLFTSHTTHLIVDINGWYPVGADYTSMTPVRLADTRRSQLLPADHTLRVKVAGTAGVPADSSAVVLNVTASGASGYGFVTVHPCGTVRPTASNLNYTAGQTVPNAVVAGVGARGEVCIYSSQTTHLIVDINGWHPSGQYPIPAYDPFHLGMSLDDAVATGQAYVEPEAWGPGTPGMLLPFDDSIFFWDDADVVTGINVKDTNRSWSTPEGIAIGSPAVAVLNTYPRAHYDEKFGTPFILLNNGVWGYQFYIDNGEVAGISFGYGLGDEPILD